MIDWEMHQKLLTTHSQQAIEVFLKQHNNPPLSAVGYWVCVGIGYVSPPPFEMCINPRAYYEAELVKEKAKDPAFNDARMRWDSGYFQYPACISLGAEVTAMATSLNDLVDTETLTGEEVREGMLTICCAAMAALARSGLFGNTNSIDFIVQNANDSWYSDDLKTVRDRDAAIRKMIAEAQRN